MTSDESKKIVNNVRTKNRGSSTLEGVQNPKVSPYVPVAPSGKFRTDIHSFYEQEINSENLKILAGRITIGEFWKPEMTGFKGNIARVVSIFLKPFHLIYRFMVAPWVGAQEKFNARAVEQMQRLINLNKNVADLLSDKIVRLEHKYDLMLAQVVNEYLVRFTDDLVSRMDILYRRLDENFIAHDMELERNRTTLLSLQSFKDSMHKEISQMQSILASQRKEFVNVVEKASGLKLKSTDFIAQSIKSIQDIDYLVFENRFRGAEDSIKEKQKQYLDHFRDKKNILDIACGRGEFLELLNESKLNGEGVDINSKMIKVCREKELKATEADVFDFLVDKEGVYDGVFCSNLVEHLEYNQLKKLVEMISQSLSKNGVFVVETINPESLNIFSGALYLDLTHIKPLHPQGLDALLASYGFTDREIVRFNPVEEESRLELPEIPEDIPIDLKRALAALSRNVDRVNQILFNHQEYGIVAYKK